MSDDDTCPLCGLCSQVFCASLLELACKACHGSKKIVINVVLDGLQLAADHCPEDELTRHVLDLLNTASAGTRVTIGHYCSKGHKGKRTGYLLPRTEARAAERGPEIVLKEPIVNNTGVTPSNTCLPWKISPTPAQVAKDAAASSSRLQP
ncbi:hypothetical protein KM043_012496 [Ampulex compressa]|nr:hypothetical protein KM043_012496 [Ampulex compressa]